MLGEITAGEQWMLGSTIVMAIGTIGALIVSIVAMNKRQEVKVEQPLMVEFTKEFVQHVEFDQHKRDMAVGFAQRDAQRSKDLQDSTDSRRLIYDKIDETRIEVSEQTEAVRRELSQKIDAIPGEIITLLRNTGAIKR